MILQLPVQRCLLRNCASWKPDLGTLKTLDPLSTMTVETEGRTDAQQQQKQCSWDLIFRWVSQVVLGAREKQMKHFRLVEQTSSKRLLECRSALLRAVQSAA